MASTASAEEARRAADAYDANWVGVLDGQRLRGWLWTSALDDDRPLDQHETRDFRVWVQHDASLRTALNAIVSSRNNVAAVYDDDTYHGMLFLEQLTAELWA